MIKHALVSLAACAATWPALAAAPCTAQTTRGDWMYTCEGSLPSAAGTASARMLGTCTSSKTAYWTCEGTVNLGGLILPQALVGQAENQPNCTGTISYAHTLGGQPAGNLDIRYVIFKGGEAISGLPTNSGGVLSCSLSRIRNGTD